MAGAGYKLFNTGDVLTAAQVNTYLQEQTVMVFASSTARTTALSGVLAEGMVSYLQDTNAVEVYNGSAWVGVSGAGDVTEVQAGTGISVASGTGPIPVVTNTMATTFDAKADLVVGTGADTFAKLTVGANDTVLTADSSTATGLKWATASSGGMTLLASGSFSGSSVTVSSISGAYNNLYVVVRNYKPATNDIYARIRLNGDTGTNYFLSADHGTYRNSQAFDATFLYMGGQNSSSASEALCIMTFWDYANTTTWKMQTGQAIMTDAANTANMEVFPMFGAWKNTGAINSINFAPTAGNFTSGDYYIYGVK